MCKYLERQKVAVVRGTVHIQGVSDGIQELYFQLVHFLEVDPGDTSIVSIAFVLIVHELGSQPERSDEEPMDGQMGDENIVSTSVHVQVDERHHEAFITTACVLPKTTQIGEEGDGRWSCRKETSPQRRLAFRIEGNDLVVITKIGEYCGYDGHQLVRRQDGGRLLNVGLIVDGTHHLLFGCEGCDDCCHGSKSGGSEGMVDGNAARAFIEPPSNEAPPVVSGSAHSNVRVILTGRESLMMTSFSTSSCASMSFGRFWLLYCLSCPP
jgi:hypothetical protein